MLAFMRDNADIIRAMVDREKRRIEDEMELDALNRYNELNNAYPCPLRYFDEVPLCRDGKEGPCSDCSLRMILVKCDE